ncbi:cbb3-type cytochrome oxidase assembly protein CcoS [Oceanibium sediminis]|uniref:cbb3-type cytochrome oxidase assembly protein CcoS n=1 Tax=Oceanibium sediminis TaxID=2026339 RepID=UPI000DD4AD5F|nr:cbb3-type cytochrome oxidase assembly protein CcoS [Oceanibium sediminis]
MTSLVVLIPISLGMGLIGLYAFVWAMRHNQFDDPDGNAWRVIAPGERPQQNNPPATEGRRHDTLADNAEDDHPAGGLRPRREDGPRRRQDDPA